MGPVFLLDDGEARPVMIPTMGFPLIVDGPS